MEKRKSTLLVWLKIKKKRTMLDRFIEKKIAIKRGNKRMFS